MNLLRRGCDENSEYDRSRDFVGKVVNWFTYNNGFHTIHHIEPGLHWSFAPAEHAKRVAPLIHPNLNQSSLLVYLFRAPTSRRASASPTRVSRWCSRGAGRTREKSDPFAQGRHLRNVSLGAIA